ncbi:MAG: glycosyltransferase family 4 protein [Pseudomonadota bacterium]|nr:glycosyltransferase family 4 protein [Pseudomonadota bacterium]
MSAHRVMMVHNAYRLRGGEDAVVDAELALLRQHGHAVEAFTRHNDELDQMPAAQAALDTVWSRRTGADLSAAISRFKPDVVHFHNTFPLISPSAYWAVRRAGLPVVQTIHNFRLHCPQAMYLRDGKVCEDCKGRVPWRSVLHGCYRESRVQSALLSTMLVTHRVIGTYRTQVTRYIALNEFCRDKLIEGGLPAERIAIKPNFVDLAAPPDAVRTGFLFVGRLSPEKGLGVLLAAWQQSDRCAPLRVAGSGPQDRLVRDCAGVEQLGALPPTAIRTQMETSAALILPSICYESFPRTLVEAFAAGLPVIAGKIGPLVDLIDNGVTGLLYESGDPGALARCMRWATEHPVQLAAMGRNARAVYEEKFTADINYRQLTAIYDDALAAVAVESRA